MAVQIIGLDKVKGILGKDLRPAVRAGLYMLGKEAASYLEEEPPSQSKPGRWTHPKENTRTLAKYTGDWKLRKPHLVQPRPMGWYERKRGWRYPIMSKTHMQRPANFGKAYGFITGKSVKVSSVAGYKLRAVSEDLSRHWTVKREGDSVVVANRVSYAAWVQKKAKQAKLMESIGWRTDEQAIEYVQQSGIVQDVMGDAIAKALKGEVM